LIEEQTRSRSGFCLWKRRLSHQTLCDRAVDVDQRVELFRTGIRDHVERAVEDKDCDIGYVNLQFAIEGIVLFSRRCDENSP